MTLIRQPVPRLLGSVLLVAAGVKCYQALSDPTTGEGLLASRAALLGLVGFELLLGLSLFCGAYPRPVRAVALLCFAGFLGISVSQAGRGQASCGCFGHIVVRPWIMVVLDLGAVLALWCWRPADAPPGKGRMNAAQLSCFAAVAMLLIAVGLVVGMRYHPTGLSEDGEIVGKGRVVLLEPDKWVGKRWPLLNHLDIGAQVGVGRWLVVLYRRDCPVCQEELPKYKRHARQGGWPTNGGRVALVEIPDRDEEPIGPTEDISPGLQGRLSSGRKWVVQVPVVLQVEDGQVVTVGGGKKGDGQQRHSAWLDSSLGR